MPATPSWLKFKKWRARRPDSAAAADEPPQCSGRPSERRPVDDADDSGPGRTARTAIGDDDETECDRPLASEEDKPPRAGRRRARFGLLALPRALSSLIERASSPSKHFLREEKAARAVKREERENDDDDDAEGRWRGAERGNDERGNEHDDHGREFGQTSAPLVPLRPAPGQPSERIARDQISAGGSAALGPVPPPPPRAPPAQAKRDKTARDDRRPAGESNQGREVARPEVAAGRLRRHHHDDNRIGPREVPAPVGGESAQAAGRPPTCQLTAKTRNGNQCAVHSQAESSWSSPAAGAALRVTPTGEPAAGNERTALGAPGTTKPPGPIGPEGRAKPKPNNNKRTNKARRTPKDKAKGVATWPLAKETLDNNLPNEFRLGHFGDCEDLLSSHLAGRLFGAITARELIVREDARPPAQGTSWPASSTAGGLQVRGTGAAGPSALSSFDPRLFQATADELRLAEQLRLFNYNHKRPFARTYETPPTGWLFNATGLPPINAGSSAQLKAKLFASGGFRRRSYDDQEGDNDINIILQPSDIDDIERQAKASYARFKATTVRGGAQRNKSDGEQEREQVGAKRVQEDENNEDEQATAITTVDGVQHSAARTSGGALQRALKAKATTTNNNNKNSITGTREQTSSATNKLKALTNIFEDIRLAKCLLDQDYNQTVRLFISKSALNWNFNSFTFDALCCGRSLTELLLHLFDYYNLYEIFNLDIIKVLKCFRLLEYGYHSTNPYHNSVHAADVTQAMHCFIQENKIRRHMTNLEILCSILAAVCHDLDHPGVNQSFLVATRNPLAQLYKNNSVLENHHWRFALCIFKESKLFDHLEENVLEDMKLQLKHLILATDIARQNDYLKRFKALTSSKEFSMSNADDRALVLQMALKCADLGNPCRPWLISRVWSNLICDEFYRMGRIERRLGVPLTPICQREKTSIAGIQTDFFRFIVLPLLELWHNFLSSPLSDLLVSNFDHNYQRWQRANRIVQQLRRRKSIACLEPIQDSNASITTGDRDERARQNRSSSLFHDPIIEDIYTSHSFQAIKRASSDYIKSGNGRLESLRDFQLNRIIEKSPAVSRAYKFGLKRDLARARNLGADIQTIEPMSENRTKQQQPVLPPPSKRTQQTNKRTPTSALPASQPQPPLTATGLNAGRDLSGLCSSFHHHRHQALSPIQDQDGASPEVCAGQPQQQQQSASSEKKRLRSQLVSSGDDDRKFNDDDQDSSPSSSPRSQASSASSSPVMQRSISSRTSSDPRNQPPTQQHQQRTSANFTLQEQNRFRAAPNAQAARHSLTHSKTIYSNRRRESDPGFLSENYELAATIVFLQYQSNPLFHKRRSSLPIFVPNRRSSK